MIHDQMSHAAHRVHRLLAYGVTSDLPEPRTVSFAKAAEVDLYLDEHGYAAWSECVAAGAEVEDYATRRARHQVTTGHICGIAVRLVCVTPLEVPDVV